MGHKLCFNEEVLIISPKLSLLLLFIWSTVYCTDYVPIKDTSSELRLFGPADVECRIKLMFSESISLSLKTRLMMLLMITILNMPQET